LDDTAAGDGPIKHAIKFICESCWSSICPTTENFLSYPL